jgi:hypothetical protein
MKMMIKIIGVEPACPRCDRMNTLAREAVEELGAEAELNKISFDSEEASVYGRVGTAHDIAEWTGLEIGWGKVRDMVSDGWSPELDDFLMPCKVKADERGWLMTPVLVINDKVICSGYVPEKKLSHPQYKINYNVGDKTWILRFMEPVVQNAKHFLKIPRRHSLI